MIIIFSAVKLLWRAKHQRSNILRVIIRFCIATVTIMYAVLSHKSRTVFHDYTVFSSAAKKHSDNNDFARYTRTCGSRRVVRSQTLRLKRFDKSTVNGFFYKFRITVTAKDEVHFEFSPISNRHACMIGFSETLAYCLRGPARPSLHGSAVNIDAD